MTKIIRVLPDDFEETSIMVGELLTEIVKKSGQAFFEFNRTEALQLFEKGIRGEYYWAFVAKQEDQPIGFISICESFAIYAGGKFGTITELYIREPFRSKKIGRRLLDVASKLAREKEWSRLEVTTPPLPEFSRTLEFFQANSFQITGGRKLKLLI